MNAEKKVFTSIRVIEIVGGKFTFAHMYLVFNKFLIQDMLIYWS